MLCLHKPSMRKKLQVMPVSLTTVFDHYINNAAVSFRFWHSWKTLHKEYNMGRNDISKTYFFSSKPNNMDTFKKKTHSAWSLSVQ